MRRDFSRPSCRWLTVVRLRARALFVLLALLSCSTEASRALAQPLDLARLSDSIPLGKRVSVLEDPDGALRLSDVVGDTKRFAPSDEEIISFGYSRSVLWVKLDVVNAGTRNEPWILELAHPTMDDIRLYVTRGGRLLETRATGDRLPFSTRDIAHGDFAFELDEPAGSARTYYLRVRTDSALRLPLKAWRERAYYAHHEALNFGYWLFCGAMVMIAVYNFGVFFLIRHREHFWHACFAVSLGLVQLAINGHLAQFVFPTFPLVADRMLPISISLALLSVGLFVLELYRRIAPDSNARFVTEKVMRLPILGVLLALFAPVAVSIRILLGVVVLVAMTGPLVLRATTILKDPELRLYHTSWYPLIIAVPVFVLNYAHIIPRLPLTEWSLQIGFALHCVMIALALASWVSPMRDRLAAVNVKLSSNVDDLQRALLRAEAANDQAARATKAKDDFMATMSHELRTPLNAIINIPQGLLEEFSTVRSARCSSCGTNYLLEINEEVAADTVCENCEQPGTLVTGSELKYTGDPDRAFRFLKKIERSGQHLLQMVNGVLDYSKMEAGRFELSLSLVDLDAVIREVVDQMSELAQQRNIRLSVTTGPRVMPLTADMLRLKQVLINLLSNAIKFSGSDSVVTVVRVSTPEVETILVQDRGIGIAAEDQERIFASFEQVHQGDTRKYGGTGLGLSISRSLVRMHGGELSVESALGHGSTFVVRLPRVLTSATGSFTTELTIRTG